MLTRLYLDNFRCFEKFEYRPARRELILGRNGSGKTSLFAALLLLRQFVVKGDVLEDHFILGQRTRWMEKRQITAELEAELEGGQYLYRSIVEPWGIEPFCHGRTGGRGESLPNVDLSNFAAWYRHLLQADQKQNAVLLNSLRESFDGFSYLQLEPAGENVRLLVAEFATPGAKTAKFYFNELSDGQRCIIPCTPSFTLFSRKWHCPI